MVSDDAWGLHAVAHVHEMTGNAQLGLFVTYTEDGEMVMPDGSIAPDLVGGMPAGYGVAGDVGSDVTVGAVLTIVTN